MDIEKALWGKRIAFTVKASFIGTEEEHLETVANNTGDKDKVPLWYAKHWGPAQGLDVSKF
ncbi:MAG: hypothetical protein KAR83_06925 [Thermodesulfovibrionales bacterium]|nr:hypothetical protein [Thermodesulfovibrionales bacterium]